MAQVPFPPEAKGDTDEKAGENAEAKALAMLLLAEPEAPLATEVLPLAKGNNADMGTPLLLLLEGPNELDLVQPHWNPAKRPTVKRVNKALRL